MDDLGDHNLVLGPDIDAYFPVYGRPRGPSKCRFDTGVSPVIDYMTLMRVPAPVALREMPNRDARNNRVCNLPKPIEKAFGLVFGHMLQNVTGKRYIEPVFWLKNMRSGVRYDEIRVQ